MHPSTAAGQSRLRRDLAGWSKICRVAFTGAKYQGVVQRMFQRE